MSGNPPGNPIIICDIIFHLQIQIGQEVIGVNSATRHHCRLPCYDPVQLPAYSCWQVTLGSKRDLFPSAGLHSPSPTNKKKIQFLKDTGQWTQRKVELVKQPTYSPNLKFCDRYLFRKVKHLLRSYDFGGYNDVLDWLQHVMRSLPKDEHFQQLFKM